MHFYSIVNSVRIQYSCVTKSPYYLCTYWLLPITLANNLSFHQKYTYCPVLILASSNKSTHTHISPTAPNSVQIAAGIHLLFVRKMHLLFARPNYLHLYFQSNTSRYGSEPGFWNCRNFVLKNQNEKVGACQYVFCKLHRTKKVRSAIARVCGALKP